MTSIIYFMLEQPRRSPDESVASQSIEHRDSGIETQKIGSPYRKDLKLIYSFSPG